MNQSHCYCSYHATYRSGRHKYVLYISRCSDSHLKGHITNAFTRFIELTIEIAGCCVLGNLISYSASRDEPSDYII
jgi:hypothetical protein